MIGGPAAADDVADYTHAYQLTTQDNAAAAAQEAANKDLFAISCSVLEHVAVQPRSITIADRNTVHGFDDAEGSSLASTSTR